MKDRVDVHKEAKKKILNFFGDNFLWQEKIT